MKEATGELNMTIITVIAIAAIVALFYYAVWPLIETMLMQNTCNTYGTDYYAIKDKSYNGTVQGQAKVNVWCCCRGEGGQKPSSASCGQGCVTIEK